MIKFKVVMNNLLRPSKFLLLFFILIFNCNNKTDEDLEKTIYYSLFNDIVDLTITDYRILVVPSITDFENKKLLQKRKNEKLDSINEPLKLVLIDSIGVISDLDSFFNKIKCQMSNSDYESIINNEENKNKKDFKISIDSININKSKYELVRHDINKPNFDNSIGSFSLSRVYFNQHKDLGVFSLSIVYGKLNALGVLILIKKENDKWQILKIIENWTS